MAYNTTQPDFTSQISPSDFNVNSLIQNASDIKLPSQAPQVEGKETEEEFIDKYIESEEDKQKRANIKIGIQEDITDSEAQIASQEQFISDLVTARDSLDSSEIDKISRYNQEIDRTRQSMQTMQLNNLIFTQLVSQLDQRKKNKDGEEDEEGEHKWSLKNIGLLVGTIGAGVAVADGVMGLFEDDDISEVDATAEIRKAVQASTDPETADAIINAGYRDQPRISDLENLANYRNQFGSLTNDMFNSDSGGALEDAYQAFKVNNPTIGRDQFLVEYARNDPTNPISQDINDRLSRMGQTDRTARTLAGIDRDMTREGFNEARKFYQPTADGGYGFTPQDFRTSEQQRVIDSAFGLVDSAEGQLLKNSISNRVRSQGELGTDTLRQITGQALTSVDPSLQNQSYLSSGGLARSVINTEQAQRNRLRQDESALSGLLGQEQNFMGTLNNVVASNTVDPVSAFGLKGSNNQLANQIYSTNPTNSLGYDPTSAYFSSITGLNNNIAQANMIQQNKGSQLEGIGTNLQNLDNKQKELEQSGVFG